MDYVLTFLHFLSLLAMDDDPFDDLNTNGEADSASDLELGLVSGRGTMLTSFLP